MQASGISVSKVITSKLEKLLKPPKQRLARPTNSLSTSGTLPRRRLARLDRRDMYQERATANLPFQI